MSLPPGGRDHRSHQLPFTRTAHARSALRHRRCRTESARIVVDPDARTARVQSGANSSDLAAATQPYGLALTTGDTASVGIGGLALGGGIGRFARKHGLTIDHLISAELVTAAGEIVRA
ncbi:MAG: FAD-binding protein, partial [Gemmatimonadaceae bacterium]